MTQPRRIWSCLFYTSSGKTSKVKSIVTYDGELDYAFPPQSVTLTLEDEIDVSRGEMAVSYTHLVVVIISSTISSLVAAPLSTAPVNGQQPRVRKRTIFISI